MSGPEARGEVLGGEPTAAYLFAEFVPQVIGRRTEGSLHAEMYGDVARVS